MQPISIVAASAEEAVARIRATLGPDAVVLNVRRLPQNGLARLWQTPMIEVLAHVPEPEAAAGSPLDSVLEEFRAQLQEIRDEVQTRSTSTVIDEPLPAAPVELEQFPEKVPLNDGKWQLSSYLQALGLTSLNAQKVLNSLDILQGEAVPENLVEQIALAQQWLSSKWRTASPAQNHRRHVLIGPAGSGKSTAVCKWLTQSALMDGKKVRVWRLDGATANTSEALSVYCDILGIPCERSWQAEEPAAVSEDVGFIDLPGVDWRSPLAIKELGNVLKQFGPIQVHLVLNGAYDPAILQAQIRTFSSLPVEDLIISHLDEETRWGKLWNLVLGTNFPLRYLSTGQNVPGDFISASSQSLLNS